MRQLRNKIFFAFIFFLYLLAIGEKSASAAAIVNPNQVYTYEKMEQDIIKLAKAYPDLITYRVIGKSEYGRNIYALSLGKGQPTVFINGSHHAREWLTTTLNMYMIEQYAAAYKSGSKISGYDVRSILNNTTIWFVPMVNPDGVTLQQSGLKAFPAEVHQQLIKMNGGSKDFKRWKANAKGVDLNRQYAADWANIKYDAGKPYYKNYKGEKPHSAAETKAILNFVSRINPEAAVAYHSSGQILYWYYKQTGSWYDRDHAYAKRIGKMTGYSLVYPGPNPSGGGFTDWFILTYKRPGFTPEIARFVDETNPPVSEFPRVWKENQGVGLYVADIGSQLYQSRIAPVIRQANKQISNAVSKSKVLQIYYSGSINDKNDIVISSKFAHAYQLANKEIQNAQKRISALPKKDQDRLDRQLQEANYYKNKAAVFIDTVNNGNKLASMNAALMSTLEKGILDKNTVDQYHQFSYQLKKTEQFINRLYGPHVRKLAAEKYVLPAKITKETIIYEISRFMLMEEIEAELNTNQDLSLIEQKLAELDRLEKRSIAIKQAGNKLYSGKYRNLPEIEKILQDMKNNILERAGAVS
ncbi:peptidase M14 carboxypeptidase A [Bacillus methanolicus PB1]|uniref:Peptidase M14 carboxypeptidase A n=1 Tax=Bacillus methanolicus PB1 TaxID=997296 RepID=I3E1U8_BACMT|nr:M14 family zinc carboxypeptidase [Bacillus methanolicus]EIJ80469.1 peptidase M14 carboxypeptidase A [Bacillus methanolicus PB1]